MNPSITLRGGDASSITLPLKSSHSGYSTQDTLEIVYQDVHYDYIIEGLDSSLNWSYVKVFINNRYIPIKKPSFYEEEGSLSVYFTFKDEKPPFSLIYGITDIVISFTLPDKTEHVFFSGYLAVAIKEKTGNELELSITSMLDDIYQKDHHLLYSEKLVSEDVRPNLLKYGDNKYDRETSFLLDIIKTLRRVLPNFISTPRTKLKTDFKIDSFEKLHTIGNQNLIYIATHPEHLKQSSGTFGIAVGSSRLFPEKTLVSSNTFTYDTLENRAVLSFVYTLLHTCEDRKREIINHLFVGCYPILVNGVVRENYILSASVIQQYTEIAFTGYLKQYELIVDQLSEIFSQYQRAIPCSYSYLTHPPTPTPAFLEMYHYRKIFELMNVWFGRSDVQLPSRNPLLQFSSADEIYEYYCLLHLCDILVELGFEEITENRIKYHYTTRGYYRNTEIENTYSFKKDDCEVTLYYQPVVYSDYSKTSNDITLFRTDTSFYSPDFIIKKKDRSSVKYGILDAKWSPLLNSDANYKGPLSDIGVKVLSETAAKYMYSILDKQSLQPVSFFWLMQGKDGNVRDIYFRRGGGISKSMEESLSPEEYREFKYATGIVPLTPKVGDGGLLEIIDAFLS